MSIKKCFVMKFKSRFINHVCIVKFLVTIDKRLLKIDKNIKFIKSMKTMEILHDKSNMRLTTPLTKSNISLTIIYNTGVIIPDPNTMKSNAMASSSSPCPSSMEATIPKNTFHGH